MNPTLLLIGDSILDNAYWNDVGKDTTAEVLRKMNINVIDRIKVYHMMVIYYKENIMLNQYLKKLIKNGGIHQKNIDMLLYLWVEMI